MTYKEIVTYIEEIPRFTRKHSLAHTREMLLFLGNPQNGKKIIHVAGTNGKGSVCAYLDAMLRAEGKSTGLFTSPHLVKMNERIVLNGKQISDEDFCEVFAGCPQDAGCRIGASDIFRIFICNGDESL